MIREGYGPFPAHGLRYGRFSVPPLHQRLVGAAWNAAPAFRLVRSRWSVAIERRRPVQKMLRNSYGFSRRHPAGVSQWEAQYAGDYGDRLSSISEVTHYMAVVGYLVYGSRDPVVLDIGCGHGRFLQLLESFRFSRYLGIDWSAEGIEQARSLSIPRTQFEVADMDHWDTSERFDAVVLNESLYYSGAGPRELFERSLGWLTEDGIVIVSMYRNFGSRYVWSQVNCAEIEQLASCEVKDNTTGKVWDVKAFRPYPARRRKHTS